MKRNVVFGLVVILLIFGLIGCDNGNVEKQNDEIHTHNFEDWIIKTEATCTTAEIRERTCSCGEKETQNVGVALGHNWNVISGIASTCIATGFGSENCTRCTETIEDNVLPN